MFAWGDSGALVWMLYLGILLHGICYDFFFVTGQIYVDKRAPGDLRGAAQGFIAFVTLGVGMFIGSLAVGPDCRGVRTERRDGTLLHDWARIWLVPAAMRRGRARAVRAVLPGPQRLVVSGFSRTRGVGRSVRTLYGDPGSG